MIEDELRMLLTDRAAAIADDNAARVAHVHTRIGGIRRRRMVATTLALVLIVAAGVLFTRLPGKPETLPAGVPAGPYFGDDGRQQSVPGYHGGQYFTFTGDGTWATAPSPAPELVVVARCDHRGDLVFRDQAGAAPELQLSCRVPVGDHFEGARRLDAAQTGVLFAVTPTGVTVTVHPGSAGSWTVGVLEPFYPDTISREQVRGNINGFDHPAGGPWTITIPGSLVQAHSIGISVLCVRDVRLEFRVSGRLLATAACTDDATGVYSGQLFVVVPGRTVTALGLKPLQVVTVDVRSTGRRTEQWGVLGVG